MERQPGSSGFSSWLHHKSLMTLSMQGLRGRGQKTSLNPPQEAAWPLLSLKGYPKILSSPNILCL